MRALSVCILIFFSSLLPGCSSDSDKAEVAAPEPPATIPDDDEPIFTEGELTDERLLIIVNAIENLSHEIGMEYRFEVMSPVTEDQGDTTRISFEYNEFNIAGGSPVAVVSNATSQLVQLDFYQ